MVYKRYIKKGEKTYGPYYQSNKKKDGKVITKYVGKELKEEIKKVGHRNSIYFVVVLCLLLVLILSNVIVMKDFLTGRVTASIENVYSSGDVIQGNVKLGLKQGELIPSTTKIFVEMGEEKSEYLLSDVLEAEEFSGDFYVEDKSISGEGLGYGFEGEKIIYPKVEFILSVYDINEEEPFFVLDENESEETEESEIEKGNEISAEKNQSDKDKEIKENKTEEIEEKKFSSSGGSSNSNKGQDKKDEVQEDKETGKPDDVGKPNETGKPDDEPVVEDEGEEEIPSEEPEENPGNSNPPQSPPGQEGKDNSGKAAPITGEVVSNNFIEASVSKDKPYEYILEENQTAKIVSSGEDVNLKIEDGKAIITTNYEEKEKGFGRDYVKNKNSKLTFDLDKLNVKAKEGNLKVRLVYDGSEILFVEEQIKILESNETLNETSFNLTGEEVIINFTNGSLKINTVQYGAVVGMPVKLKKKIVSENVSNMTIELPKEAKNISVSAVGNDTEGKITKKDITNSVSITGQATADLNFGEKSSILNFFKRLFGSITGRAIDVSEDLDSVNVNFEDENASEYEIDYEMPAPVAFEEETSKGKLITISSDYRYENILAFSELSEEVELNKIKFYYYDEFTGEKSLSNFDAYDSEGNLIEGRTLLNRGYGNVSVNDLVNVSVNSNGNLVSFITWVVPHLSNQTYEIIIEISNAEHLDSDRNLIENIYDFVKAQDGNWSPAISNGEYVRVTFEENLTSVNDITVYARGDGSVEIYTENGNEIISTIEGISEEGLYKTYLTGLNGSNDVFDLKILGSLEFDYIVDPLQINSSTGTGTNVTTENNYSHLILTDPDWVLYMPFDVAHDSSNITYDYSENNYDGTATNGVLFNSSGGVYGGGYDFDGAADYISTGVNWQSFCSVNCSFSIWVNPLVTGTSYNSAFGSVGTANNGLFWEDTGTNNIYFRLGGSGANQMSKSLSGNNIVHNQWNHLVVAKNGTSGRIFVNGVDLGYGTIGGTPSSGNFLVGALASTAFFSKGSIDEVMVFNRSLSSTEVAQIYNSTYSRFYPTGEMLFEGLDFGVNNTVNITLDDCRTLNGSLLYGKINDGVYQELESCSLSNYEFTPTGSDNLTLRFNSGDYGFYSPLVVGNISLNDVFVQSDVTAPSVTFENPTPDNGSRKGDSATIVANITDDSNVTSWIDFDNSLVGYWGMNDYNSTGVYDNSSYENFGLFAGGAGEGHLTSGKFGDAFETDSVDGGYIDLGSDFTVLDGATSFTVSAWVYKEGDGTYGSFPGIIGIGSSSQRMPWIFGNPGLKTLTGVFETNSGASDCSRTSSALSDDSWNHVVLTWDGSDCWLVINNVAGAKDAVSGTALVNSDGTNYIGKIGAYAVWNGSIDEVMFFNRSLSSDEISALYDSNANKFNATFNNLESKEYDYTLYAIDSFGNLNTSTRNFISDGVSPLLSINSPSNNSYVNSIAKFDADVSDDNGDSYTFINDSSLLGYWTFDTTDSLGVYDTSGNNEFGTFAGGLGESNLSFDNYGNSLIFDGVDDYVSIKDIDELDGASQFTFSLWVKGVTTQPAAYVGLVHKGISLDFLVKGSNNLFFRVSNGSNSFASTTSNLLGDSNWHHVVGVFDGTQEGNENRMKVYVDSSSQPLSFTGVIPNLTRNDVNPVEIGKYNLDYYNGSIDEFLIFNRSLSQEEISALYNSSAQKFNVSYTLPNSGVNNIQLIAVDTAGNINSTTLTLNNDLVLPTITYESPTPDNGSIVSESTQTITANITDDSEGNTSSFIDFDRSLVGYWGMDYYNSTGVFDNSSYGNFGTFTGTGFGSSNISQGVRGNGLNFDGVNDYVNMGNQDYLNPELDNFSVSVWIKTNYTGGFQTVFFKRTGTGITNNGYGLVAAASTGKLILYLGDNSNGVTTTFDTDVVNGEWNNVVLTLDREDGKALIYINGVKETTESVISAIQSVNSTQSLTFGKLSYTNNFYFNGSLDEVLIFNRSLSQSEISALYDSKAYKFNATFDDLSDGQHDYTLYAIDSAGNLNSSSQSFSFDGTYPLIEFINGTENNATSFVRNYIFVNVSVTELNEDTISFGLYNSTDLVNLSSFTDGTREINFTSLEDGTYYYNVSVNDSSGNLNSTETREITLDTTSPEVSVQLPVSGNTYTVSEVTFQVTTNENSTCEYSLNSGVLNSSLDVNSNGTIHTATQTGISNAAYTVNYYCDDLLGNSNNTQNSTFTVSVSSGGTGDTGGGSSSGGGGGPAVTTPLTFSVNPESIERTLAVNRIELGQIDIVNNRNESVTYNARVEILSSMIAFEENSITLEGGESGVFEFKITPLSETGIYTGKIIITGGSMSKEIPVIINIRTEKSLYDLILTIPRNMKVIDSGENLFVQIDLLQMGIREKMDVTLNYVIKDYSGKVYLVESETIAVENQKTHEKEFHTQDLPDGEYVLGVELIYPDGVAVASSQFRVGKDMGIISNIGFAKILILGALIFVLVIVFLIARRYRRLSKGIKGKK